MSHAKTFSVYKLIGLIGDLKPLQRLFNLLSRINSADIVEAFNVYAGQRM